jgi:hypothetical protein
MFLAIKNLAGIDSKEHIKTSEITCVFPKILLYASYIRYVFRKFPEKWIWDI